jgi:hypothetical protein
VVLVALVVVAEVTVAAGPQLIQPHLNLMLVVGAVTAAYLQLVLVRILQTQ